MSKELIDVNSISIHFNLRDTRNKYTNIYAVIKIGVRQAKIPIPYKIKSWLLQNGYSISIFHTLKPPDSFIIEANLY